MDAAVKEAWVAALRSGEYSQTKNKLKTAKGEGHCCLGVLTDIYAKALGIEWSNRTLSQQAPGQECSSGFNDPGLPGAEVTIWAELEPRVVVTINGRTAPLYWHNDHGVPFNKIADAIEEQL